MLPDRDWDYPPISAFKPPDGIHNDKLQRNGCEASGRVSGKVCGLDPALIRWTQGSTLMWQGTGFSGFTLFGLFKKQTLTGRRLWELRRSTGPFEKKPIIPCFSLWHSWWEFFFFLIFGFVVYEVRERESIKERQHWKQDFLKRPSQCRPCAVIWSVLTELSRGMEKIIRRNVWGALKRSRPRDWPMGERPAERRANFFLMNSTACSTM